jgi:tRNA pseudouridine55 synthase
LLIIDKPLGITSRDAVNRAARWFPRGTRIGHTGTLDPQATGVLVLCIGVATRLAEYVEEMKKTYRTCLHLGARSTTDDAEGTIQPTLDATPPESAIVQAICREFVGEIEQAPPPHSAIKVGGKRAYELARKGAEVKLKPRRVQIDRIDVIAYAYPALELEVDCGKGTYIRSLARDIGTRLGCGAYVESLRRTAVGGFNVADAIPLDSDAATALARLLPMKAAVAHLFPIAFDVAAVERLQHGQTVALHNLVPESAWRADPRVAIFHGDELAAIAEYDPLREEVKPVKVLRS